MGFRQVKRSMVGWDAYGLVVEPPFDTLVICGWDQLVSMELRPPKQGMV